MSARKYIRILLIVALLSAATLNMAAAQNGGNKKLTVALSVEVLSLDTHRSTGTPAEIVRKHIYEGLVKADEQNQISPLLATGWEVSEDQKTWTFTLRDDVMFHDGTPFNAEAVKVNLERLIDPNSGSERTGQYAFIDKVDVVDEFTVAITTKEPFGAFLANMAFGGGSFMSPAALEKYGQDIGSHPVGTGPYMFKEQVGGESVTLVRNENYWGEAPYFDEIEFVVVKEDATRVNLLQTGQVDFIVNVPAVDIPLLEANPDLAVTIRPSTRVAHIGINTMKGPLQDVRVRQALNYAIDREALVDGVLGGVGLPATSIVSPMTWGYADVSPYTYDPDKARELLAEAGYPNGFKAKLWTPSGRYFMDKQTAEAVQAMFADIGVETDLQVLDWGAYLDELRKTPEDGNDVELYLLGWETTTGEAGYILERVFDSASVPPAGWNTMFYTSDELDQLTAEAQSTTDQTVRAELLGQAQAVAVDDAPWVLLYVYQQIVAHRADLEGVQYFPNETMLFSSARIAGE
jgi:ABC-type transport system substrate-binding protein